MNLNSESEYFMNKKIGIITLNGYFNYGNRLQNYALEKTIEKLGYDVDTIIIDQNYLNELRRKSLLAQRVSIAKGIPYMQLMKIAFQKIDRKIRSKHFGNLEKNRRTKFLDFSKKYLHETPYSLSESNMLPNIKSEYLAFVVGSDQVWNPHNNHGSPLYFLRFADQNQRISYAASIAVDTIPTDLVDNYSQWLADFHRISVREEEGKKLVENISSAEASVHVDPTMLLTKDEWLDITIPLPVKTRTPYALTYFIGTKSTEKNKWITSFIKKYALNRIDLVNRYNQEAYSTGPSEFVNYINQAEIFFTDSFHGVVFSILMKKPFIVFKREGGDSMYSRIDTLLKKFSLTDRVYENRSSIEDFLYIDYSYSDKILKEERERSLSYLVEALREVNI